MFFVLNDRCCKKFIIIRTRITGSKDRENKKPVSFHKQTNKTKTEPKNHKNYITKHRELVHKMLYHCSPKYTYRFLLRSPLGRRKKKKKKLDLVPFRERACDASYLQRSEEAGMKNYSPKDDLRSIAPQCRKCPCSHTSTSSDVYSA